MNLARLRRVTIAAVACSTTLGCALSFNAETLGIRATVAQPAGQQVQGADFRVSKKAVYLLWGTLPVTRPSLESALSGQLVDGDEIANLEMHVRSRFGDLVITALTLGVVVPRSVTYRGTVVKNP